MAVDSLARIWASQGGWNARAAAKGIGRISPGYVGRRIVAGRVANTSFSAEGTYEMVFQVPGDFDQIRPIFAFGSVAGPAISLTIARSVPNWTDAASNAATRWIVQTGGSNSFNSVASASASRRNFMRPSFVTMRSVPRDDGGSGRLVVFRCKVAAGAMTLWGNGSQDFSNWASHPTRAFRSRFVASTTNYASDGSWSGFVGAGAATANGNPIIGYEARYRGKVVNIEVYGDSNQEGQGSDGIGYGPALWAADALNAQNNGLIYEVSNLAWSGQAMQQTEIHVLDAISQLGSTGTADIAIVQAGTPNGAISSHLSGSTYTLTNEKIYGDPAAMQQSNTWYLEQMLDSLRNAGRVPMIATWAPTNTAAINYGTSDSFRRAFNDEIEARAARGDIILPYARPISGSVVGGQTQMVDAYEDDNIHFNSAGIAVLGAQTKRGIEQVVIPPAGLLAS